MVFITPLASTAIFPATVFTPCLNCVMSGPEGSTPSKPDVLPERRGVVVLETSCVCVRFTTSCFTFPLAAVSKQVRRADGGASGQALQFGLGLVLEEPTKRGQRPAGGQPPEPERRLSPRRRSPGRRTCLRRWPWRWRTSAAPRWTPRRGPPPRLSSCWEVWGQADQRGLLCSQGTLIGVLFLLWSLTSLLLAEYWRWSLPL